MNEYFPLTILLLKMYLLLMMYFITTVKKGIYFFSFLTRLKLSDWYDLTVLNLAGKYL